MNKTLNERHGAVIRKMLQGRVPESILGQMTDQELAEEDQYHTRERIRWTNRTR